jgi:hypothetical protein
MENEKQRIAETEALFRDVNERIADMTEGIKTETVEFYCECADPTCLERLEVPLGEYERVRRRGATSFLLVHGHEEPSLERIVEARDAFSIVEKVEKTVADIVSRLDPRGEPA